MGELLATLVGRKWRRLGQWQRRELPPCVGNINAVGTREVPAFSDGFDAETGGSYEPLNKRLFSDTSGSRARMRPVKSFAATNSGGFV